MIQDPDAAGDLGDGQHKTIPRKRKTYSGDIVWDHFAGVVERGHRERLSHGLALCRIKAHSPDIEEAAARGYVIDRLSIGRPLRFVVPALAVRDAHPWAAGCRGDKDCGSRRPVVIPRNAFEYNPAAVRGVVALVEVVSRIRDDTSNCSFRMRSSGYGHHGELGRSIV